MKLYQLTEDEADFLMACVCVFMAHFEQDNSKMITFEEIMGRQRNDDERIAFMKNFHNKIHAKGTL